MPKDDESFLIAVPYIIFFAKKKSLIENSFVWLMKFLLTETQVKKPRSIRK